MKRTRKYVSGGGVQEFLFVGTSLHTAHTTTAFIRRVTGCHLDLEFSVLAFGFGRVDGWGERRAAVIRRSIITAVCNDERTNGPCSAGRFARCWCSPDRIGGGG